MKVSYLMLGACCLLSVSCDRGQERAPRSEDERFAVERERMVRSTIRARGVRDPLVILAMLKVRRHLFVPPQFVGHAYADHPLSIGSGQTISQPYIVAFMTEAAALKGGEKVLEIGTGSGYGAAVLAQIAKEVYTIEILPELAESARARLQKLGYKNVHVRCGDGYRGWPEVAPFDAVVVTASPDHVPKPLVDQLKVGGRLVIPVGRYGDQELKVITKRADGTQESTLLPVRFVPMTGEAERQPRGR